MILLKKDDISFHKLSPDNVDEYGLCCIKNKKAEGYKAKDDWIKSKNNKDVNIIIARDNKEKQLAFIEYLPAESAWRPVKAANFLFIQCIAVFSKKDRHNKIASTLIELTIRQAKELGKDGVCTMTSKGVWIADSSLFARNNFTQEDKKDRFELMVLKTNQNAETPYLLDWDKALDKFKGWNLLYSNQCPWHIKSVNDLVDVADSFGIYLNVKKIDTAEEAQNGPSGFGTFALIKDGKLLSDHYLSASRFKNIVNKEIGSK